MKEWEHLQKLVVSEAHFLLFPNFKKHQKKFGSAAWNKLFDTGGPTTIEGKPTPQDTYFSKIFQGFTEIETSVQMLRDIVAYISVFPYRGKKVTKSRYLRYHVETYLNEMYLLKERLNAFITYIGRSCKRETPQSDIVKTTKKLSESITKTLEGIMTTRGKHVHRVRFQDKDFDRLDMMELFTSSGTDEIKTSLALYYKIEYSIIRNKWVDIINKNNENVEKMLDFYGGALVEILFDKKTGRLLYPRKLKTIENRIQQSHRSVRVRAAR
jgi:hypothetical protein